MVPMLSLVFLLLCAKLGKNVYITMILGHVIEGNKLHSSAAHSNVPLYQYIAKLSNSNIRLPVPAFNVRYRVRKEIVEGRVE